MSMLLYIHIPFCRRKCNYCNFFSVRYSNELFKLYYTSLLKEIQFWGERFKNKKFSSIYMGGGTPSIISHKYLGNIIECLYKYFSFEKGYEFTLEGNPDSLKDIEYLRALKALGINRLSIGVQSLQDNYLRLLGRIHNSKDAILAIKIAQLADFDNINVDLIWGLPSQRVRSWLEELKQITKLGITHISCYGLTIEENTPLASQVNRREITIPDEKTLASLYLYGSDLLESMGFIQYEISNFAKLGFACRHNMGYWEGMEYLGLGPSAVSTVGGVRWENPKNIQQYHEAVTKERLGKNALKLTPKEQISEFIMLRLRTSRGLSLKEYARRTGKNLWRQHPKLINLLHQNRLIRIRNGYLSLTKNGFLVSNAIIEKFLP